MYLAVRGRAGCAGSGVRKLDAHLNIGYSHHVASRTDGSGGASRPASASAAAANRRSSVESSDTANSPTEGGAPPAICTLPELACNTTRRAFITI